MKTTYFDLIDIRNIRKYPNIYVSIERILASGVYRSQSIGLDGPVIYPAATFGQHIVNGERTRHEYYEGRYDRIWNTYLTQHVHGTFYVENADEACILEKHGWKITVDQEERDLCNPGTGSKWHTSPRALHVFEQDLRLLFIATN